MPILIQCTPVPVEYQSATPDLQIVAGITSPWVAALLIIVLRAIIAVRAGLRPAQVLNYSFGLSPPAVVRHIGQV